MTDKLNGWFGGNVDALDLYERLVFVAHAWDDFVDKDRDVEEADVNNVFANLLLYIPGNKIYRQYEADIRPLIYTSMLSYRAANLMERSGCDHKVEIAHYLRYAIANVAVFLIGVCNNDAEAPEIIAKAMPVMIPERMADYKKEHLHA